MNAPWLLKIGEPFVPERTVWDDGRFEYRYFSGNHLLQICWSAPSRDVIRAFSNGSMHVAVHEECGVLFFLFKISGFMDWSDQALSIWLVPEEDRSIPTLRDGENAVLTLALVDADNGRVRALRVVTYSPRLSRLVLDCLRHQLAIPFNKARHQAMIASIYRRDASSSALARRAAIIERAGSNRT